jgi:hypothetical protein
MSRARDVADIQDNAGGAVPPFVAGKNKIINGDFGVWQRGTTFTNATVNTFNSDRWFFGGSGNNTGSISRQTFTPGTAPVAGYEGKFFYRFDQTSTAITPAIIQRIEDVQTFAGQTVTLSFWVKTSAAVTGGITNIYLEQMFGSGGSGSVGTLVIDTTNTTTSWTRVSGTITLPSISGKTIGTGSYLQLTIYPKASTVITFDIWGVQLEAGSVATPFTTATGTIQGELAACQRYYQRITATSAFGTLTNLGIAGSTTLCGVIINLPVTLRVSPTAIDYSTVRLTDQFATSPAVSALTIGETTLSTLALNATSTGLTIARSYRLEANNSTSAYVGLSAEL